MTSGEISVRKIISNVIDELIKDSRRKFAISEIKYFE
jgi:hypothetical protein